MTEPTVRTSEAAAIIGISPHALRRWNKRYDLKIHEPLGPSQVENPAHRHYRYSLTMCQALRDALLEGLSGESAIRRARDMVNSGRVHDSAAAHERIDALVNEVRKLREVTEEIARKVGL